jgi:hypothetical protein
MNRIIIFLLLNIPFLQELKAQDEVFERLQAIENNGTTFYNIDGIEITNLLIQKEFSIKNILKSTKKYSISENELNNKNRNITTEFLFAEKKIENCENSIQFTDYYFIKTSENKIRQITFASSQKIEIDFETKILTLILENNIPKSVYNSIIIDTINFAGRKIDLGLACHWMGVNNIQTSNRGQFNWSVCKDLQSAKMCTEGQRNANACRKEFKLISEIDVDVVFEGTKTKAKKIIWGLSGTTKLLARMSGGKTLTVYYVTVPVRETFVSCVLSHWDSDLIESSGFPKLFEEVMQPKK